VAEDYVHRVGRTARAGLTGEAFTFVSPDEDKDLRTIERTVGQRLARRTLEGFDYQTSPAERFEVPIRERIAQIRAQRAEERARSRAKAQAKSERQSDIAAERERRATTGAQSPRPRRRRRRRRPNASVS
jgi:ATP-dependent RNA helicase RhlE